jgi:hypothetical protein
MNTLLLLCALIGTTLIIVRGSILAPVRNLWPALFGCAQCAGTWVGIAAGASGIVSTGHGRFLDAVIVGAAASFASLLADAVLLRLLGDPSEEEREIT